MSNFTHTCQHGTFYDEYCPTCLEALPTPPAPAADCDMEKARLEADHVASYVPLKDGAGYSRAHINLARCFQAQAEALKQAQGAMLRAKAWVKQAEQPGFREHSDRTALDAALAAIDAALSGRK